MAALVVIERILVSVEIAVEEGCLIAADAERDRLLPCRSWFLRRCSVLDRSPNHIIHQPCFSRETPMRTDLGNGECSLMFTMKVMFFAMKYFELMDTEALCMVPSRRPCLS